MRLLFANIAVNVPFLSIVLTLVQLLTVCVNKVENAAQTISEPLALY